MNRREELKKQLITTFQGELEEHLETLNRNLLALEKNPPSEERHSLLVESLRAAHSLKGAARAVEIHDIEVLAHRMEDIFTALERGELSAVPSLFDTLFPVLDALKESMAAFLRGETLPEIQREDLLAGMERVLKGEEPPASAVPTVKTEPVPMAETEPALPVRPEPAPITPPTEAPAPPVKTEPAPALRPAGTAAPFHPETAEETIRVSIGKLDALMANMDELVTIRMRTELRMNEIRSIQQRLARWDKRWRKARVSVHRLQRQSGQPAAPAETGADLRNSLNFLNKNEENLKFFKTDINRLGGLFTSDYHRLSQLIDDMQGVIRQVRMLPIATLFEPFPRMVRDLARQDNKEMELQIEGAETEVDRQVLEAMKDPLVHLLRNAVDHGIELPARRLATGKPRQGTIHLSAAQKGNSIILRIADDGAGIDWRKIQRTAVERGVITEQEAASLDEQESIQLIFRAGMSTAEKVTDISGRGIGLDVVKHNLEKIHGLVEVDPGPGAGSVFTLRLPLTLATTHVLLVKAGGQTLGIPTTAIERILRVHPDQLGSIEGKPALNAAGRLLILSSLTETLQLPPASPAAVLPDPKISVVILGSVEKRIALQVDELLDTQEVVIKTLGRQLRRVRNITGATILGNGQLVMILNAADLVKSTQGARNMRQSFSFRAPPPVRHSVLVADDSITTRTLEKSILESAGYDVLTAADGREAWNIVQSCPLDAVVSDVSMPEMDGFVLTEKIKQDERFKNLPVVLVTSLESVQHRIRGLEAGADAYVVKSTFDHQELMSLLERLIG